jgi:hypothetical protein
MWKWNSEYIESQYLNIDSDTKGRHKLLEPWNKQFDMINPLKLSGNVPRYALQYFIILLCLTPDNFTHQGRECCNSMG